MRLEFPKTHPLLSFSLSLHRRLVGTSTTPLHHRRCINMATALSFNPNLSSPFLGHKLPVLRSLNKSTSLALNWKIPKCSVNASQGGAPKFPRRNVWDPYKRLGISNIASSEEVWSSRNFLLEQYAGDEPSVESIEAAFEKLLMKSFIERKKTKINLKTRLKQKVEESPSWVKNMLSFVEFPEKVIVLRRLFLFTVLAGWSIMNQAEGGPAFQVAVALAACVYFLYDKSKSLGRASAFGFGSLVAGWICGSFVAAMVPTFILPATWTLELSTSLVAFVFMCFGCTYLK